MESLTTYASDGEKPKRRHCEHSVSSATEFEELKFKRPRVSAVRDFPASFEQFNAQRNNGCGDDPDAEPREIDHVEPHKNTLDSEENDSSLWCLESNVETDDGYYSDDLDDATYNNDPFEVTDHERSSSKLELQYVLTKVFDFAKLGFKRPKVSATRDFPAAFQQFGAQTNGGPDDSEEDVVELREIDRVGSDYQQNSSPPSETHELSPRSASEVEADVTSDDPEQVVEVLEVQTSAA